MIVTFINNSAESGGAIYAYNGSTVIFQKETHVVFDGNVAQTSGGVIYANDHSLVGAYLHVELFELNGNHADIAGGAIYVNDWSAVEFKDIQKFRALDNYSRDGGFLYVNNNSRALFEAAGFLEFSGNTAQDNGGAIYVNNGSTVTFRDIAMMEVKNNRTINGNGIFFVKNNSSMKFERVYNILAQGNRTINGGFLSLENTKADYLSSFQMLDNDALGNGGAVNITNSVVEFNTENAIKDSIFSGNEAAGLGGAIYIENNSQFTIKALAYSAYFNNNTENIGANDVNIKNNSLMRLISAYDQIIKFESGIKTDATSQIIKEGLGDTEFGGKVYIEGKVTGEEGTITIAAYPTPVDMNEVLITRYGMLRTKNDDKVYTGNINKLD
jgi:predicted outer membrane repeat protein